MSSWWRSCRVLTWLPVSSCHAVRSVSRAFWRSANAASMASARSMASRARVCSRRTRSCFQFSVPGGGVSSSTGAGLRPISLASLLARVS
uniref:Uncharacterized protein n=1 Tax=uncultured marine virus TaxID=186617 RepID=A0A0F7L6G1_9VIRU|nr:hypothetical protein [uncultured marine virus]